jgi:hypothetical protein
MEEKHKLGGKMLLGEILLERGLITKPQLDQALRVQVGGMRRLGSILVRMKLLTGDDLTEALSAQLKLPIVKIEDEFRDNAKTVLPRHLCRKYSVLPLSLESNNVVRLAMADPLDGVAIADVENYTGHAVQPVLARLHDIDRALPSHTVFSRHDLFNPQVYHLAARAAVGAALCLLVITGFLVYREVLVQRYGTETVSPQDGSRIFTNHDLRIEVAKDGSVYFSGRGAYANGYYGVRFENTAQLTSFVKGAVRQFSTEQIEWLGWAFREKLNAAEPLVATKNP